MCDTLQCPFWEGLGEGQALNAPVLESACFSAVTFCGDGGCGDFGTLVQGRRIVVRMSLKTISSLKLRFVCSS